MDVIFRFWFALALSINRLLDGCIEHCVAKIIVVNCIILFLVWYVVVTLCKCVVIVEGDPKPNIALGIMSF
jgi:hypothetical protein